MPYSETDRRRILEVLCTLAASLPPLGLDVGVYGTLLWFSIHEEARRSGAILSTDDAIEIMGAAAPELAWALLGSPSLKWLNLPIGIALGGCLNVKAAHNVGIAMRLYLASGRRLRGHALRQELEDKLVAERRRRKMERENSRLNRLAATVS